MIKRLGGHFEKGNHISSSYLLPKNYVLSIYEVAAKALVPVKLGLVVLGRAVRASFIKAGGLVVGHYISAHYLSEVHSAVGRD